MGLIGEWAHIISADQLGEGEMFEYDHRGEPIVVARTKAGLFAFDGWCTHEECPLVEGILNDREVECYCHGSIFDLRTGEALIAPAVESLTTYPVREREGAIEVEL